MACLISLAAGCGRGEQIERYTVNKPQAVEKASAPAQPVGEPTDRTLAAIVPHGEQGWFFKLTGPKEPVAAQVDAFASFVETVRFSADGKPSWTLPEGWTEQLGGSIRYATLTIAGEAPLEISVTALPKPPGDDENYALVNINRWRGQLQLPPIELAQLGEQSSTIELDGARATLVDIEGTAAPDSMGRPPFFPGAGDGS